MVLIPAERYPKLRSLDIRPCQHEGRHYLLLRDPAQLSPHPLLVPQPLALVLAFCDGTRDAGGLASAFYETYGITAPLAPVEELVAALDEALMLENERAAQAHLAALEDFRNAPYRPPALAGLSYPADGKALWKLLQDYLEDANGVEPLTVDWSRPPGLLSPHIDYLRGGPVYAQVWKRAAQVAREADLVVIFGTDHYGADPFTLTHQNYATPYGTLPTARWLVDALAATIGEETAFAGELRHRGEHSLELVAVWLHHLREGQPVEVVPILVGGLHHYIHNGATPAQDELFAQVVETLRTGIRGRRVLVIASGDLAHVGPAFGGAPLDQAGKQRVQAADQTLIDHLRAGDAERFFGAIQQVRDRNNVCGVTPLYLTLRTLGQVRGEEVAYAICPADETERSVVTVCGMVFC
ncbi:MAG: AmmeMemoRadiSam system protein B [Chloroflexi bacterium]|nr:MAG: AmmeMemoRadiSam system protein B [Chloroflexota bacterium]